MDLTFIIQGKHHPNTLRMIPICKKFGKVIVSAYEKEEIKVDTFLVRSCLNPPKSQLSNNLPLQIRTTLNGLCTSYCNTKLAIKIRSDEYYENLEPIVQTVRDNPEKWTTNNIFFIPSLKDTPHAVLHTSDHIIGCKTDMLIRAFELADQLLNNTYQHCTDAPASAFGISYTKNLSIESFLCFCWFHANGINYSEVTRYPEAANHLMKQYCRCVDIDLMKPYEWVCNKIRYNDSEYLYNNGYNRSIRKIEDLDDKICLSGSPP